MDESLNSFIDKQMERVIYEKGYRRTDELIKRVIDKK